MELVLHLGAHRTGSTALAAAVQLNRAALEGLGLAFRGPQRLRDLAGFSSVVKLTRQAEGGDPAAAERLAGVTRALRDQAAGLRPAVRRLMLSEENILGTMRECLLSGELYPGLAYRLEAYARVLPRRPDRIALGIRSYDSFWASAYMFVLMRTGLPDFADLWPAIRSSRRGWAEVVGDIRQVFPAAGIILWRQEDTGGSLAPVLSALAAGTPPAGFAEPPEGVNAGWPAADRARIAELRRGEPDLAGEALKHRLRNGGGAGAPPAAPFFTEAEAGALRAAYRRDWAALQEMGLHPVTRPAGAAA